MKNLSVRLKELRSARKVLQKDIADLLKVTIRQYQRYEGGEQEPNISSLIALADFFGVSLDYLCGRSEIQETNERKVVKTIEKDHFL